MPWLAIRNCGHALILSDCGEDINADFLTDMVLEFAKIATRFYNAVSEFPFVYKEKQIRSVVTPALMNSAKVVFEEQPALRKAKGMKGISRRNGWIDYWVLVERMTYLVELKYAGFSSDRNQLTDKAQNEWSTAINQLSISKKEANQLAFDGQLATVALQIMPIWQCRDAADSITIPPKEKVQEFLTMAREQLTPQPNWSAVWYLHGRLQNSPQQYDRKFFNYPGVMFFARLEKRA
ncbi:MAG: hypothetical protein RDU59_00795 [Thermodesulfobacteriota bacterium]|nr:hypothetical protein [Thermodesulfobacteriota bacterium]